MANKLYDKGRGKFATGDLHWKVAAGDTFKAFLVDLASYTPDFAVDEFAADIPQAARFGSGGGSVICDADDIVFLLVPAGNPLEAVAIFKSTGDLATSPLVAYIDYATGLPVTPNGANITVQWDSGANKIFKL